MVAFARLARPRPQQPLCIMQLNNIYQHTHTRAHSVAANSLMSCSVYMGAVRVRVCVCVLWRLVHCFSARIVWLRLSNYE